MASVAAFGPACLTIDNKTVLPGPSIPAPTSDASAPLRGEGGAAVVDAGVDGDGGTGTRSQTYYVACTFEFDPGQPDKVVGLYGVARYSGIDRGAGTVEALSLTPLKIEPYPPVDVKLYSTDERGNAISLSAPADTDSKGSFAFSFGTLTVQPDADPMVGSSGDLVVTSTAMRSGEAFSTTETFCAHLTGEVTNPAFVARTLDPAKNTCVFFPMSEGEPLPLLTSQSFACSN